MALAEIRALVGILEAPDQSGSSVIQLEPIGIPSLKCFIDAATNHLGHRNTKLPGERANMARLGLGELNLGADHDLSVIISLHHSNDSRI